MNRKKDQTQIIRNPEWGGLKALPILFVLTTP